MVAERNGKIAYSNTEKFQGEWEHSSLDVNELNRAGRLKLIPRESILDKQSELEGMLESDDPHIIALAIVAKIKVLVVQRQPDEPLKVEDEGQEVPTLLYKGTSRSGLEARFM